MKAPSGPRGWADWLEQSRVMQNLQNLYIYRIKPNITRDPAMPDAVRQLTHDLSDMMWASLVSYMRDLLESLDEADTAGAPAAAPIAPAPATAQQLGRGLPTPSKPPPPRHLGMMGFLEKQSGHSATSSWASAHFTPYQRRWFVLDEAGCLRYYRQPEDMDGEGRGEIMLSGGGVHVSREAGTTVITVRTEMGAFQDPARPEARELRLRAATEEEVRHCQAGK